jgi:hypothetical protein
VTFEVDNSISMRLFGFSDTVIKLLLVIAEEVHKIHMDKRSEDVFEVELNDLLE